MTVLFLSVFSDFVLCGACRFSVGFCIKLVSCVGFCVRFFDEFPGVNERYYQKLLARSGHFSLLEVRISRVWPERQDSAAAFTSVQGLLD